MPQKAMDAGHNALVPGPAWPDRDAGHDENNN
jgi:hypothetical protein